MRQDTYTLHEGELVLAWPESMTPDEVEDVGLWLDMMKKKLQREASRRQRFEQTESEQAAD